MQALACNGKDINLFDLQALCCVKKYLYVKCVQFGLNWFY